MEAWAQFYSKQKEFWPHIITSFKSEEANQEKIKQSLRVIHSLASIEDSKHLSHDLEEVIDIKWFSSKAKLLRTIAIVFKFFKLLRKSNDVTEVSNLAPGEVAEAEKVWIKFIHAKYITGDAILREQHSNMLKLHLRQDQEGIIWYYGRIINALLSDESKTPILLPAKQYFTDLLLLKNHLIVHHDGIRETLNAIRENYWIIQRREAV